MTMDAHDPPGGDTPPDPAASPEPDTAAAPIAADQDPEIPLGQRLFDSPFLLLIAGTLIMFVFFTGWGVLEVLSLDPAPLP